MAEEDFPAEFMAEGEGEAAEGGADAEAFAVRVEVAEEEDEEPAGSFGVVDAEAPPDVEVMEAAEEDPAGEAAEEAEPPEASHGVVDVLAEAEDVEAEEEEAGDDDDDVSVELEVDKEADDDDEIEDTGVELKVHEMSMHLPALLQRVCNLNKNWDDGKGISVHALKNLRQFTKATCNKILVKLEKRDPEDPTAWIKRKIEKNGGKFIVAKRKFADTVARADMGDDYVPPPEPEWKKGKGKGKGKKGKGVEYDLKGFEGGSDTRALVSDKVQHLIKKGFEINMEAMSALFKVSESIALGVLNEATDRQGIVPPSQYILKAVKRELERRETNRPTLPNPELFKQRFGEVHKQEEARKGKKGKGKGKDKGKGKK